MQPKQVRKIRTSLPFTLQINCTCIFRIHTFWVTMRKRKALNWGVLTVAPGTLAGRECGESSTVLGFTIFSTNINQASKNSPVPSGSSRCSRPSDTGTFPPMDRAQLNVLIKTKQNGEIAFVNLNTVSKYIE